MGDVIQVQTTRCCGLNKDAFRDVYFSMFPYKNDGDFDTAWTQYEKDKASHIHQLNALTDKTP